MNIHHQCLMLFLLLSLPVFAHAERVAPVWWIFINGFVLWIVIAFFVLLLKRSKKDKE